MIPVNEAQHQLPDLIDSVSQSHQPIVIAGQNSNAVLLIEFDSKFSKKEINLLLKKNSIDYRIEEDVKKQKEIWNIRKDLLTIVENKKKNVIAFVEDIGVPPKNLALFIKDLQKIFAKNKIECVIFGHAGEGNLHLRPIINHTQWKKNVNKMGTEQGISNDEVDFPLWNYRDSYSLFDIPFSF